MNDSQTKREEIARTVNELVVSILGHPDGTQIDPQRSLKSIGIDSLLGMDLTEMLQERFGVSLPDDMVNDHPTLDQLAKYLEGVVPASTPAK
jgi:acyl carrier protein